MKIVQTRRISQAFFFSIFVWFCVVSTVGDKFWQLRGWPVNWFLQLDPLVAIGTVLTTYTLYWPLPADFSQFSPIGGAFFILGIALVMVGAAFFEPIRW